MAILRQGELVTACRDLQRHTLEGIHGDLARLIYIASTRDYATGRYHHDGLSFRCGPDVASKALAICHKEIFLTVALSSLKVLVSDLEDYARSSGEGLAQFISTWTDLQPFRVVVPLDCDKLTIEMFSSNVTVALVLLRSRIQPSN